MLPSLGAQLLINELRLVRPGTRDTAPDRILQTDFLGDLVHTLGISGSDTGGSEQVVHLFEGKALGLWKEEEDEGGASESEETEEDVGSVSV